MNDPVLLSFIRESNAIEGVHDSTSVIDSIVAWRYLCRHDTLTPRVICSTHKKVMKNQPIDEKFMGHYRNCDVTVGGKLCLDPDLVEYEVEKFTNLVSRDLESYKVAPQQSYKLEDLIMQHHRQFELIHPFIDGNGRVGRLIVNWERQKMNLPILIIWDAKKQEYYKLFR